MSAPRGPIMDTGGGRRAVAELPALVKIAGVTVAANAANQAVAHGLKDFASKAYTPTIVLITPKDAVGAASVVIGSTAADGTNVYLTNTNATTAGNVDVYVG